MRAFLISSSAALVLFSILAIGARADAQSYSPPRQYSLPYVPLAGGTPVPLMGSFDPLDDGTGIVPLGFTFRYFGVDYTQVNVSVNGFLTFGAPCTAQPMCETFDERCDTAARTCVRLSGTPTTPQLPAMTTTPPNRLLAVFWTDLVVRPAGAPPSAIVYQVSGTAPDRVLTVEWRNIRHYGFNPPPEAYANFQIKLFERSNLVRYHYGQYSRGTSDGAFIGGIELKSPTGTMVVGGLACNPNCSFMSLVTLADSVIEFGAPNAPMLTGAVFPPVGPRPGETRPFRLRADNVGLMGTGVPFQAAVYISPRTGTVSPLRDQLLGTVTFPALGSLGSATATLSAMIPAATMPGYYTVGALFDSTRAVAQPSRSQNLVLAPRRILIGDIADFTIAVRSSPARREAGDPFNVVLELKNVGAPTPRVGWELRLTRDLVADPLGVRATGGMKTLTTTATDSLTVFTVTATVPNVIPGTYRIIAVVNPGNAVPSADPTNNRAVAPIPMTLAGADLLAATVSGPTTAFRGQTYTITYAIQNTGMARASNFNYAFYFADAPLITVFAHQLREIGPVTLLPGQRIMLTADITVPTTLDPRDYYLGLIVDTTNAVMLENRSRTITRQLASVRVRDPAPRFVVSAVDVADLAIAGQSVTVQRTFDNTGNAPGTAPYVIYLSRTRGFDPARAVPVGMGTVMLNPSMPSTNIDRPVIPADTAPGNYYLVYVIDPDNTVDQLDRLNSTRVSNMPFEVIPSQLAIRTRDLPIATIGTPYQIEFSAIGGTGPYVWSIASGTLPEGLSFDAMGRLSGTPSVEGMSMFKVAVSDGSLRVEKAYTVLVAAPTTSLQIATRAVPPAFVGHPYDYPLVALGGVPPYTWVGDGVLPRRITLSSMGRLIGTATVAQSAIVNFKVTDATGRSTERPIAVRSVDETDAVHLATDTLPDGVINQPYDEALRAIRGVAPYVFTVGEGALPDGLAIDAGRLTGSPKRVGLFNFVLRVTDGRGDFDLNRYVVNIAEDAGVKFVTKALPAGKKGVDYLDSMGITVKLRAVSSATTAGVRFSVLSGTLPTGLMLETDGRIRGKPTAGGVFTFTVAATDALGEKDLRAFGIVIEDPVDMKPMTTKSSSGCSCGVTKEARAGGGLGGLGLIAALGLLWVRRRRARKIAAIGAIAGFVFMAGVSEARAQMPVYQNSEGTDPYVHRTMTTRLTFIPGDDDGDALITLPFMFHFYDRDYTTLKMGTNGYVAFGPTAIPYPGHSLPLPQEPTNLISLYWDDLITPDGSWVVEGTAPNRVAVLQWSNVTRCCSRTGLLWEMQLWLFEGRAGKFEIHYGPAVGSPAMTFINGVSGYENLGGTRGFMFLPCTFHCSATDYVGLNNRWFRATQDAGLDLSAVALGAPSLAYPGIPFTVTSSMSSAHGAPIGPFVYAIHLVRAGETTPNNPIFTSGPITLGNYELRGIRDQVTIPLTVTPGRYRLALEVDSAHQIDDPDRSNNVIFARNEIALAERLPDFTVSGITPGNPTVAPGDALPVTVRLRNAGNLDGTTAWKLYISRSRVVTVENVSVFSGMVTLPLLSTATVTISAPIPANTIPGRYYIGAIVDPDNVVRELNKLNNTGVTATPITIGNPTVGLATTALPGAYVGVDYSAFLRPTGGDGSYTFQISSGTLPVGLLLDTTTGEIHGRPMMTGTSMFGVHVASGTQSGEGEVTLDVSEIRGGLTIVTRDLIPGVLGQSYPPADPGQEASTLQHLVAVGGAGPATFSLGTPSSVPPGLTLDADGLVHGVPTLTGHFDLDITATDGTTTVSRTVAMTVVEPGRFSLIHTSLPDGFVEQFYEFQLRVIGRRPTATVAYSLVSDAGNLPDGLALTTLGRITGMPRKVGTWRFAIRAVEGTGTRAPVSVAHFILKVQSMAFFRIMPNTLPNATIGKPYLTALEVTNGTPPFTWRTIGAQRLPPGLITEIVQKDGRETLRFTGTATAAPPAIEGVQVGGLVSFLVTVSDSQGLRTQQEYAIRVVEAAAPPPATSASKSGCSCAVTDSARAHGWAAGVLPLAALLVLGFAGRRARRRGR